MFIGIDPGAKGAICLLRPGHPKPITFQELDAPIQDIVLFLRKIWPADACGVEQVRSLPNMTAKSNFSFGYNLGMIETLLQAEGVEFVRILPKMWQKGCGITYPKKCPPKLRKEITAQRAHMLYPNADLHGPRGGLRDGRADALMIAHYLMQRAKETTHAT